MSAEIKPETEIFQSLVAIVCTTMQGKQKMRTRDARCVCVRQMCRQGLSLCGEKKVFLLRNELASLVNASLANFLKNSKSKLNRFNKKYLFHLGDIKIEFSVSQSKIFNCSQTQL